MADLQVLQSKAVCIIFYLSPRVSASYSRETSSETSTVLEELNTAPSLLLNQLITFFPIHHNIVSIVIFIVIIHAPGIILQKTAAKTRLGHINCATEWNSPDLSLRDADSLSSFKRSLSEATIKVPLE